MRTKTHSLWQRPLSPRAAEGFTVLELLIVIGVLSVLLAIILPTVKTLRSATLRRKAAAEATALAQAAIHYKTEYSFWPGQLVPHASDSFAVKLNPDLPQQDWHPGIVSRGGDTSFSLDFTAIDSSIQLAYVDGTTASNAVYQSFARVWQTSPSSTPKTNPLNPRGIMFLDLQNENDITRVGYPDPWGRPYILIMGLNPRSIFTHQVKNSAGTVIATHTVSNQIAFAFSRGPTGPDATNYIYSAGVTP